MSHAPLSVFWGSGGFAIFASLPCPGFVYGQNITHWSTMGSPHATDREIMEWAKAHDRVVFTHDLDFGILTQDRGRRIQSAALDSLPEAIGFALFMTLLRSDSPQSARQPRSDLNGLRRPGASGRLPSLCDLAPLPISME